MPMNSRNGTKLRMADSAPPDDGGFPVDLDAMLAEHRRQAGVAQGRRDLALVMLTASKGSRDATVWVDRSGCHPVRNHVVVELRVGERGHAGARAHQRPEQEEDRGQRPDDDQPVSPSWRRERSRTLGPLAR